MVGFPNLDFNTNWVQPLLSFGPGINIRSSSILILSILVFSHPIKIKETKNKLKTLRIDNLYVIVSHIALI